MEVLPRLARARLASFRRPCGAAKASNGWGGALAATLIHPCADAGPGCARGALLGSLQSSGRKWPAPPAGPQRSPPAQSARPGTQALPGCASLAAALPVTAAATPNPGPLDLMALRRGRSSHDAKGAGQIVRSGNLPGGGGQLCPQSTPRAASGVA